jgi:serine/threonine protein kinase
MIGSVIDGRYRIIRSVGAGGMGCVYEAEHTGTGRHVAVKLINIAEQNENRTVIERFFREARAAGAIDTQHITQVLDVGTDPATGAPYMVMELLLGEDLKQLLDRLGPLPPDLALRLVAQACFGLQRAHEAQVIHRDIKPANIFLAKRDAGEHVVKLLDFGIAKIMVDLAGEANHPKLTRTASILGSPAYMSPEQLRRSKVADERTDIWSLGVVLYELLTGRTPQEGIAELGELIVAICCEAPRPIHELAPWVPPSVASIAYRALNLKPAERFQTAQAMFNAIRAELPNGWTITGDLLVPVSKDAGLARQSRMAAPALSISATQLTDEQGATGQSSSAGSQPPGHAPDKVASSPMGRIKRMNSGETLLLRSQMLLGRSAACDLRVNEPRVSSEHARLRWTGTTWEVRDLGSKNGTFVGGRRLASGDRAALIAGDAFGLGGAEPPAPLFVLIDAAAPVVSARSVRTGLLRLASGGLITLPDDEHPEICVVEGREGKWTIETEDTVREASDGETLTIGDEAWVLDVPGVAASTLAAEAIVLPLESIELRFVVSLDQRDVALTVVCPGKEIQLSPQRHHSMLLALARERLRSAAAPPAERGWVDRGPLCRMSGTSEQRINVDVCSARRELAALGIHGAANVIERRPGTGALRLGVERVEVRHAAS